MRIYKFSDGNKLTSIFTATILCIIADIEVSIVTDIVGSNILLLLSEDGMMRAKTCLNFENDNVTMLERKASMKCTSSGHYYFPITRPQPDRGKFNQIFFIKEIPIPNRVEKVKNATKLSSHPRSKKLCDLVKKAGIENSEFINIL